jgi:hypothetical protein
MIYDKGKIFLGLAIFVGLVASPFWYNPVFGTGKSGPPEVKLPVKEKLCVLPRAEMRASHMQVIFDWRETVVRGGGRAVKLVDGREFTMSLSNTCLGCHDNKKEFCDTCHGYLAVQPFCWDCHFDPKEQV